VGQVQAATHPDQCHLHRHQGQIIDAEYEGIVAPAIFEQVQELIRENGNGSGGTVRNKHGALLKGILRCGQCGAAMAHTYTKKGNRLYRYYTCTTYQKQGPAACSTRSLPAQEIEDFVVEQIRKLARDPDLIREVFQESIRQRQEQLTRLESERKRQTRKRQQKGEEIRRLVSAIAGTAGSSPALSERLAEAERQLANVDRRLQEIDAQTSTLRDQSIDLDGVTAALEEFEAVWGVMTFTEQGNLIRALVREAAYDPGQRTCRITFCHTDVATNDGTVPRSNHVTVFCDPCAPRHAVGHAIAGWSR